MPPSLFVRGYVMERHFPSVHAWGELTEFNRGIALYER
jgi:hypothetical protein